ncbi:hypothetical protein B0H17DRAFT_1339923 [Mycena rosella]|uniref:Uncharacterized protein n=1 Tax=Mycena rosella TaxID=1033263 RepID=A0AAD7BSV3_MYCRO|nr:hypothetical protein B0H17DRAFT_1339923 [Mycena rosella]
MSSNIKIVFPNECCDSETLRVYEKYHRLGADRIQDLSPGLRELRIDDLQAEVINRSVDGATQKLPESVDFDHWRSPFPGSDSDEESDSASSDDSIRACGPTPPPSPDLSRSLALVSTFDETDPAKALAFILGDPTLVLLYQAALGTGLTIRTPDQISGDVLVDTVYGHPWYYVRTAYHQHMIRSLMNLSCFLHCAANDHLAIRGLPPMGLPQMALEQIRVAMRGISLFRCYEMPVGEDLNFVAFQTKEKAIEYVREQIFVYYVYFLLDCFQRASAIPGSVWNVGAGVSMPKDEADARFNPPPHPSIRRLMNNAVLANEMDFKCANFIRRPDDLKHGAERLVIVNDRGQIHANIWPMPQYFCSVFENDAADIFMHLYLSKQGLTMEDLDREIIKQGNGDGLWLEVPW